MVTLVLQSRRMQYPQGHTSVVGKGFCEVQWQPYSDCCGGAGGLLSWWQPSVFRGWRMFSLKWGAGIWLWYYQCHISCCLCMTWLAWCEECITSSLISASIRRKVRCYLLVYKVIRISICSFPIISSIIRCFLVFCGQRWEIAIVTGRHKMRLPIHGPDLHCYRHMLRVRPMVSRLALIYSENWVNGGIVSHELTPGPSP